MDDLVHRGAGRGVAGCGDVPHRVAVAVVEGLIEGGQLADRGDGTVVAEHLVGDGAAVVGGGAPAETGTGSLDRRRKGRRGGRGGGVTGAHPHEAASPLPAATHVAAAVLVAAQPHAAARLVVVELGSAHV